MADVNANAQATKAEAIGTVKTVVGTVKAVDASGVERILQAGDKVFANETIVTAEGALVLIEFANGAHLDLASASRIVLDSEVYTPAQASNELTAEQIQEMIARGEDPTAVTEATAAGAGAGDEGGSSFVVVDFNNTQGEVTAGFNTLGIPAPEGEILTELPPVEEEPTPPVIDTLPSAGTTDGTVDDDGLFGANPELVAGASVLVGVLPHDFGADGPGDINFAAMNGVTGAVGSEQVTYTWNQETHTLTATSPRGVLFTITVDPLTGGYQLNLLNNVLHPSLNGEAGDNTENDVLLGLIFTVVDSDDDRANGTLNVTFNDDVPSVTVGAAEEAEMPSLTTQDAQAGATPDTDSQDFSGLFTLTQSGGADGGTASVSYALSIGTDKEASGLTSGGSAITLTLNDAGEIEGRTAEDVLVFKISVDAATGEVTLSQYAALDHTGELDDDNGSNNDVSSLGLAAGTILLTARAEITDGDDDTATDDETIDISSAFSFDDDVPSVTVADEVSAAEAAALSVTLDETVGADRYNGNDDEAGDDNANADDGTGYLGRVTTHVDGGLVSLFGVSGSYGADGAGRMDTSLSFVGIPESGLATTLQATDGGLIKLFLENGAIVGRDTDNDAVFKIEIVTVNVGTVADPVYEQQLQTTLYEAIYHPQSDAGMTFDETAQLLLAADGAVQLKYEVTRVDADGDSVTDDDTVDLITDEASFFGFQDDAPQTSWADTSVYHTANSSGTATVVASFGSDGPATDVQSITLACNNLPENYELQLTSNTGGIYTWTATYVGGQTDEPMPASLFTVTYNTATGSYTFQLLAERPNEYASIDVDEALAGGKYYDKNGNQVTSSSKSVYKVESAIVDGFPYQLIATASVNGQDATLSVNNATIGVGGDDVIQQTSKSDDRFHLQFVRVDQARPAELESVSLTVTQFNPNNDVFRVIVKDTDGTEVIVTSKDPGVNLVKLSSTTWIVTLDDFENYADFGEIKSITLDATNSNIKVIDYDVKLQLEQAPGDYNYQFTATAVDGDGDIASDDFTVTVMAGTSGNDNLFTGDLNDQVSGGAGNDIINTGAGNDILIGGAGDDILIGGLGSDTFKFSTLATNGVDSLQDFKVAAIASGGDVLDVTDLLSGTGATLDNVASGGYLSFSNITFNAATNTTTATLNVDLDGSAGTSHAATQVATVTMTGFTSAPDSTAILNSLLTNNEIKIS